MRKSSGTSDDESGLAVPPADDETDTEFHESLPEDVLIAKDIQFSRKKKNSATKSEPQNSDEREKSKKKLRQKHKNRNEPSHEDVQDDTRHVPAKRNHKLSKESEKHNSKKEENTNRHDTNVHSISTIKEFHISFPEPDAADLNNESSAIPTNHDKHKTGLKRQKDQQARNYKHYRETFELKSVSERFPSKSRSLSMSIDKQEDSITSVIPVITISKTESDEDVLDKNGKVKIKSTSKNTPETRKSSKVKHNSPKNSPSDSQIKESSPKISVKEKIQERIRSGNGMEGNVFFGADLDEIPTCSKYSDERRTKYKQELVRSLLNAAKDLRKGENDPGKEYDPDKHHHM